MLKPIIYMSTCFIRITLQFHYINFISIFFSLQYVAIYTIKLAYNNK